MRNKDVDEEWAYVYAIKNPSYNEISFASWDSVLYPGTPVIYETRFGLDLGVIVGPAPTDVSQYRKGATEIKGACLHFGEIGEEEYDEEDENVHQCTHCFGCQIQKEPEKIKVSGKVSYIDHLATPQEMVKFQENQSKVEDAVILCREKIQKHNLDMKLVSAHFLLSEPKVIFFFISEDRVDFRSLVKELVSVFKIRIELRQIGVRDESRLIGGLSVCGRDYCCHAMNMAIDTVSIKMAKEQNLSLNSGKISGPCGRLLCCLAYEYDSYMEEKANLPPENTKIKVLGELWRVNEVNILSENITLVSQDGRQIYAPFSALSFSDETGFWILDNEWQEEFLIEE